VGIENLEDTVGGCSGLLKIGVDATEFARRAVHHEEHGDERHELAGGQAARRDLLTAVPERQHERHAAHEFHERRQHGEHAGDAHARPIKAIGRVVELHRFARLRAERLHDPMTRERFGADMRHVLERLLAAGTRAPHPAAELGERIEDERRTREAHERKPRVVVHENTREENHRQRFTREITNRLGHRALKLTDVVGDSRHQPPGRLQREERRGLTEHVAEQLVAEIVDDALPDVSHQVRREIRAQTFEEIEREDRERDRQQIALRRQDLVEDRPDEGGHSRGASAVHRHRQRSARQPPTIGARVAHEAVKRRHAAILCDSLLSGRPSQSRADAWRASARRQRRWYPDRGAGEPIRDRGEFARRTHTAPPDHPRDEAPIDA
jgi:hypothetical protein